MIKWWKTNEWKFKAGVGLITVIFAGMVIIQEVQKEKFELEPLGSKSQMFEKCVGSMPNAPQMTLLEFESAAKGEGRPVVFEDSSLILFRGIEANSNGLLLNCQVRKDTGEVLTSVTR